ncbi:hypothetical protein B0I37DRAFT_230663 [Chaetomium sp. MPI-CAGE-AT-0009]|nr:hypothetical protein B0I37DRAFT_230663 [Chaetomium sp. MPI-CAGE-AT-0009]
MRGFVDPSLEQEGGPRGHNRFGGLADEWIDAWLSQGYPSSDPNRWMESASGDEGQELHAHFARLAVLSRSPRAQGGLALGQPGKKNGKQSTRYLHRHGRPETKGRHLTGEKTTARMTAFSLISYLVRPLDCLCETRQKHPEMQIVREKKRKQCIKD